MSVIDLFIVFGFLALTLVLGVYRGRHIKSVREYAVGNKEFSTVVLIATVFATLMDGNCTIGVSQRLFTSGVIMLIALIGYAFANFIVGLFIAPKIGRFRDKISTGEIVETEYGKIARILVGGLGFIYCASKIGVQVGAFGYIFNYLMGMPKLWGILLGFGIVVIYSAFGGIKAVTFTDIFQFAMIISTVPIIATEGLKHAGMWGGIHSAISQSNPAHFNPFLDIGLLKKYLPLMLIISIPSLHPAAVQRLLMAKDEQQARKAFMTVSCIQMPFFVVIAVIAFAALTLNPELDSNLTFPYIVQLTLPIVLRGFVIAGIFAIIMSSADSLLNSGSVCLVHDCLKPIWGNLSEKTELKLLKSTVIICGIVAVIISLCFTNLVELIMSMKMLWVPLAIPPIIGTLLGYKRSKARFFGAMGGGVLCILFWEIFITDIVGINALLPATLCNGFIFFGPKVMFGLVTRPIMALVNLLSPVRLLSKFLVWVRIKVRRVHESGPIFPKIVSYYNRITEEYGGDMGILFGAFMTLNIIIPYFMWKIDSRHNEAWVAVRVVAGVSCAMLIFKERWTQGMLRYWGMFYHFALMVSLPLLATFAIFDTEGSVYALLNATISLLMLVLLVDWKNFLLLASVGSFFGWVVFRITNSYNPLIFDFHIPTDNWDIFTYTTLFTLAVGLVFSRKRKERKKYLLESAEAMASIIAHELRTPLATASLAMNRLEKTKLKEAANNRSHMDSIITKEQLIPIKNTKKALNDANRFIDMTLQNVCDPKKLNEFPIKLSMSDCVEEAVESYPFDCEKDKRNVHVDMDGDFDFAGTKLLVIHVIYNLMKNALRSIHLAGKGKIYIYNEKSAGFNSLVIKDTGIGIPKYVLPNIGSRFISNWERGSGLGLAFCKEAVKAMHGRVDIASQEKVYTQVTLHFPEYQPLHRSLNLRKWPKNIVVVHENVFSLRKLGEDIREVVDYEHMHIYDDPLLARIQLNERYQKGRQKHQCAAVIAQLYDGQSFFKAIQDREIKRIWITERDLKLENNPYVDVVIKSDDDMIEKISEELNWPVEPPQLKLFNKYR